MTTLQESAHNAIKNCLGVKKDEKVLIVTDKNKRKIADVFFEEAKKVSENAGNVKLIETPVGKRNGEEPPSDVAGEIRKHDVAFLITTTSLSHTKARKDATEKGVRIASMPGITKETIIRTLGADYNKIREKTQKLAAMLENGKTARITTELGTDMTMSIEGRKIHGVNGGIFDKKGDWGNLPEGEACMAPVEGTANGIFYVDCCMGTGLLKSPLKITVKDGFAVSFEGEEAKKVLEQFDDMPKKAFSIAELGIGTNDKAVITGNILEDEKVLGTAHIALGNNMSFEGTVDVPIHIDGVFRKPTIEVDGKKIMEDGNLLV